MKKLILLTITLVFCFQAEAQIGKGSYQIGIGGLPIIYPNNEAETGYSLRANFGYFLGDNLAIGILPFAGKVNDMSSFGASIYLRFYLMNKGVSLFIEGGGGFGNLKYDFSPQYNGTMNTLNLGPGIHYKFKNKLAVEFLLQYARLQNITFPENTSTGNTVIPTFGIQYFIER